MATAAIRYFQKSHNHGSIAAVPSAVWRKAAWIIQFSILRIDRGIKTLKTPYFPSRPTPGNCAHRYLARQQIPIGLHRRLPELYATLRSAATITRQLLLQIGPIKKVGERHREARLPEGREGKVKPKLARRN